LAASSARRSGDHQPHATARWSVPFIVLFAVLAIGCSHGAPSSSGEVDRAMVLMQQLAVAPRTTEHTEAARALIERTLRDAGVKFEREVVGTVELPEISVLGTRYRHAHPVTVTDPNYVMRFGPPGPALLVMAHYDSVADSPGAADNAAAVAIVIELARSLAHEAPRTPVMLALTAAEENGLVGAEALSTRHRDDVAFAISLDLVGGDGDLIINGASTLIGRTELSWLAGAAARAGITLHAPPAHRVVSRWWPQAERSDHGPFTRLGVRAVHLYDRGTDGEWIDLAYHSDRDVPARVHRASVADLGRLLRALVASPVPAHGGDGYWVPVLRNVVVPRALLLGFELVLLAIVIASLVLSRNGLFAALARDREEGAGVGLVLGALCYLGAIIVAIVIERATAGAHPAPWLHAPLRALAAEACIIGGGFGLATRLIGRVRPWCGEQRYLALAIVVLASIGTLLLAIGAAEVAWIWIVPAAVLAIAPRLGRAGRILLVVAAMPIVVVLQPALLREAAWNGFLPPALPLAAALGFLGIPLIAAVGFALRGRRAAGPMGTFGLGLGCGLLLIVGLLVAATTSARCSALEFKVFHLACERV
jgi:hypothetical protein